MFCLIEALLDQSVAWRCQVKSSQSNRIFPVEVFLIEILPDYRVSCGAGGAPARSEALSAYSDERGVVWASFDFKSAAEETCTVRQK